MKKTWLKIAFSTLWFALVLALCYVTPTYARDSYEMPESPDPSAKYLFFIHNLYVEKKGPSGECDYYGILDSFSRRGFTVISEVRSFPTAPEEYAGRVAGQVRSLVAAGVSPENITVSGHSKGAFIALWAARILGEPGVKFVIMAGCGIAPLGPAPQPLAGRFLSILDASDKIAGTCEPDFVRAGRGLEETEMILNTGLGHRLFFTPKSEWLEPVVDWIKKN